MKKKKVLFISSWYPNRLQPTNGNFVQRHAEAANIFNDVQVLHAIGDFDLTEKFSVEKKTVNGIRTVIVYYKNSENPLKNFTRRMQAYNQGFKQMEVPDIVHANVLHNNMLFAVYLKKRFNIPFVMTEHWTAFQEDYQHLTSKNILRIAKFIGNSASIILPVSKNLAQSLKFLGIKAPMKVISNVVDTETFKISEKTDDNPFTFLHISSLVPRKNADKIANAVIKLKNEGFSVRLEIGGDGDIEPLHDLVAKKNADSYIKTFGALTYAEVAEKMQQSDCFVLFSDNETQGCVILESLACGKPVISTAVGGVPEFLTEEFGMLIEKQDEEALYNVMKAFCLGKKEVANVHKMHAYVEENFSQASIGRQFSEIYHEVLSK